MTLRSNAAAVRFEGVTKRFGSVVAVDAIDFVVEAGRLVTLLGPSGCGKTTTLRMIAGLEMPSDGRIFIGDQEVTHLPATDRDVSMVFQSYALFPHMNVSENVGYGLKVSGVKRDEARARTADALNLVGLADYGARMPGELCGGQQQRVAVARALVLEPQVLLFDEPLSNLDAKLRRRVRDEIREIQQTLGLTTAYVTHDQEEALAVSDRIIVMRNAAIAQEGTPRELYESPADGFVADFIGDANIVDAEVVAVRGEVAEVALGGLRLSLPNRGTGAGPVRLAIRPEAILARPGGDAADGALLGTIRKATYLGSHLEYAIDTDFGRLSAVDPRIEAPIDVGADVSIRLQPLGLTLLPA